MANSELQVNYQISDSCTMDARTPENITKPTINIGPNVSNQAEADASDANEIPSFLRNISSDSSQQD
jgi:hypothetical protein